MLCVVWAGLSLLGKRYGRLDQGIPSTIRCPVMVTYVFQVVVLSNFYNVGLKTAFGHWGVKENVKSCQIC